MERSVSDSRGVQQIVAALSAPMGLSPEVFNRYKSHGVEFVTNTPWDEVKRLYEEYPIDTQGGTQYFLELRSQGPLGILGATVAAYELASIPAVSMQVLSSEGYFQQGALLTADGTVLTTIPHRFDSRVYFGPGPRLPQHGFRRGPGFSFLEARRILDSYRKEVELRIQEDPAVCLSDDEAEVYLGPMFDIWKENDPAGLQ
jgi:hypothetical protein